MTWEKIRIFLPLRRSPSISAKAPAGCISIGNYWAAGSSGVLYFSRTRRTSMSVYFTKGKGWRYDFTLKGDRYTKSGYKTKTEARQAEANRREAILNPQEQIEDPTIPTDMAFLDLVNHRLDYVKAYNSERHYTDHIYLAKRWVKKWGTLKCSEITAARPVLCRPRRRRRGPHGFTAGCQFRCQRRPAGRNVLLRKGVR